VSRREIAICAVAGEQKPNAGTVLLEGDDITVSFPKIQSGGIRVVG